MYGSQLIEQFDRWSFRVISLGFLFLTIGILSGSVIAMITVILAPTRII